MPVSDSGDRGVPRYRSRDVVRVPAVFEVTLKVLTPEVSVEVGGRTAALSELGEVDPCRVYR